MNHLAVHKVVLGSCFCTVGQHGASACTVHDRVLVGLALLVMDLAICLSVTYAQGGNVLVHGLTCGAIICLGTKASGEGQANRSLGVDIPVVWAAVLVPDTHTEPRIELSSDERTDAGFLLKLSSPLF